MNSSVGFQVQLEAQKGTAEALQRDPFRHFRQRDRCQVQVIGVSEGSSVRSFKAVRRRVMRSLYRDRSAMRIASGLQASCAELIV